MEEQEWHGTVIDVEASAKRIDQQWTDYLNFCIDRCMNGNPWPPELSDVIVSLSGEAAT